MVRPSAQRRRLKATARQHGKARQFTLRDKLLAFVGFFLVIAVVMTVFRDNIAHLGSWGYLGAFIIAAVTSATVFLPTPGSAAVLLMARDFNPLLLGMVAGLGTALGSLTAYWLGAQARSSLRERRLHAWACRLMERFGDAVVFILNLVPVLPMDLAGLVAGATRYPVRRFLVFVSLANVIKTVVLVYAAAKYLAWLESWLGLF